MCQCKSFIYFALVKMKAWIHHPRSEYLIKVCVNQWDTRQQPWEGNYFCFIWSWNKDQTLNKATNGLN